MEGTARHKPTVGETHMTKGNERTTHLHCATASFPFTTLLSMLRVEPLFRAVEEFA